MNKTTFLRKQIYEVLRCLDFEEMQVIRSRFGLSDGLPKTMDAVSSETRMKREEVRACESEAMRKLRMNNLDPDDFLQSKAQNY